MASATYSYQWQGVRAESILKDVGSGVTDVSIDTEPNAEAVPITMAITLSMPGLNVPPRGDLDDTMRQLGWRPVVT